MQNFDRTIAFTADIKIEAGCADVYKALDMASPDNRYLARGMTLDPIDGKPDRYAMCNPQLPDVVFTMTEVEAEAPGFYHMRTEFPNGEPIGILTGDETRYRLTPTEDGHCHLLATGLFFTIDLYEEELEQEEPLLQISVHDDLARLKALIEAGANAADSAGLLDDIL